MFMGPAPSFPQLFQVGQLPGASIMENHMEKNMEVEMEARGT